ncbi:MAG: hypothetical protein R2745_07855 [Vicinamibacterales bacterium]
MTQCLQLVEDVARISSLTRKASAGRPGSPVTVKAAERLARAAKA